MSKVFNFRCPDDLMTVIEGMAETQGISKSEAAMQLMRLGLQAQGAGITVPERKTKSKTEEGGKSVRQVLDIEEIEERLTSKTKELIEASYCKTIEQVNGLVQVLREEFSGELNA